MALPNVSPPCEAASNGPVGKLTEAETADTTPKKPNTLYPKIGKLSDFICRWKWLAPDTRVVPVVGTVKLHGAHVDWVISRDNSIRVQSRNLLEISLKNDNYEFAAFSEPIHDVIVRLKDDLLRRYEQLNPSTPINLNHPVVISGEWCGQGVQKGMAISQLPRHFVIISIRINDTWVSETEYDIKRYEDDGIYHIGKAGCYRLDLDVEDIDSSEATIQALVTGVEKTCPYGLARGVRGRGEGIVWKARDYVEDPTMWFKYKADSTAVSHEWEGKERVATPAAGENREREYNFAVGVVTERRLEQGLEYLAETGVKRDRRALGTFLTWIRNDVLVEEQREMQEKNIGQGRLKPAIASIARTWYNKKLIEDAEKEKSEVEEMIEKVKDIAV
ncbi:MAG: hypothetical protein L6R40_001018 [Gallowayella cf. fulva]|nr:MAG: hypothetical protein L6R40_001018 [Xanthomendoza cf. fulva]